jgi:hypothetical protein
LTGSSSLLWRPSADLVQDRIVLIVFQDVRDDHGEAMLLERLLCTAIAEHPVLIDKVVELELAARGRGAPEELLHHALGDLARRPR